MSYFTLRVLGLAHATNVLDTLAEGKRRFNRLKRPSGHPSVDPDISSKTLSGLLKHLETAGLVERNERGHQHVEYGITDKGRRMLRHAEAILDG